MSIAAAIITALGTGITTLVSGKMQADVLEEGKRESKEQYGLELSQRNKELKAQERLRKAELAESKRQAKVSERFKEKEFTMTENQLARKSFREQVQNLTGVLDKNEQLKSLFIDRFKGLRN